MNRQTIAVAVGAAVLFVVAVVGAMAFTGGNPSGANVHTMPGGPIMTGPMHTMSGGAPMPGMTHP